MVRGPEAALYDDRTPIGLSERWQNLKIANHFRTIVQSQTMKCTIPNCDNKYVAKGFCGMHYRRWKVHGDPLYKKYAANGEFVKCALSHCPLRSASLGFCEKHYRRYQRYGDPMASKYNRGEGQNLAERFWSRVNIGDVDECWEWTGGLGDTGYGYARLYGLKGSHRVAYYLATGNKPTLWVLHSCDNKLCCNPKHLREGDVVDNTHDKVERERQVRGEKQWNAKITEKQAKHIKRLLSQGIRQADVMRQVGVSRATVFNIKSGKCWRYVSE